MRRPWLAVLVIPFVGVAALLTRAGTERTSLAFTTGVHPQIVAAQLGPGRSLCQGPIDVPASFDRVALALGRPAGGGPPLAVTVRGDGPSVHGSIAGGYRGAQVHLTARVPRVRTGRRVSVCLRNRGRVSVAVLGGADAAAPLSHAESSGTPLGTDIVLDFRRSRPPTLLEQSGTIVRRATLFHPGFVQPLTLWILLALVVAGAPALLAMAVGRAGHERDR